MKKLNSHNVSFKTTADTSTAGRKKIAGIAVALVVLFVLGFVIGWVSAPRDSNETFDMKYIAKKRKQDMKKKAGFHEELFEILNAEKIGENLR
jgi:hypothetical protein